MCYADTICVDEFKGVHSISFQSAAFTETEIDFALVAATPGYILRTHMNKHKLIVRVILGRLKSECIYMKLQGTWQSMTNHGIDTHEPFGHMCISNWIYIITMLCCDSLLGENQWFITNEPVEFEK